MAKAPIGRCEPLEAPSRDEGAGAVRFICSRVDLVATPEQALPQQEEGGPRCEKDMET